MLGRIGAGIGIGIGSGAAAIGWYYSSLLLDTAQQPVYPERVLAVDDTTITLADTRPASQPGIWGLRWAAGLAVVGPVVERGAGAVVRSRLDGPAPSTGTPAMIETSPYDPDPGAVGLAFSEVDIPTPLGRCPAWLVPGDGRSGTWVLLVHGRGGSRRDGLRVLPALHGLGHPALALTYRNDPEAPPSPDGRYHLGDTEWEDLEAGVRYALSHGARRVVLVGWSMGAAIIGAFLSRSPDAPAVVAMVWDAPLVDWRATLRHNASNRRLPPGLTPFATSITSRRIGIDFDRFDLRRRPPAVRPPTLIVHSAGDTIVPVGPSRALAAAAHGLDWPIRYLEVPGVDHIGSWNADPGAYEQAVTSFLVEVVG